MAVSGKGIIESLREAQKAIAAKKVGADTVINPERELAEELSEKNARALEDAGLMSSIPTPENPVPAKTVSAPEKPSVEPDKSLTEPEPAKGPTVENPVPQNNVNPPQEPPVNTTPKTGESVNSGEKSSTVPTPEEPTKQSIIPPEEAPVNPQETLNTGSGQTLGDIAQKQRESLPWLTQTTGDNGVVKLSVNRDVMHSMVKEKLGDHWYTKGTADHRMREIQDMLDIEYTNKTKGVDLAGLSQTQRDNLNYSIFSHARDVVGKEVEEGAGVNNFVFGNKIHTGLVGMAAIGGTMGVAFSGHKSNAELYSSPY